MKVLIITGAYPPVKCGVGDYTFHLANALAQRRGIEVCVLTSGKPSEPSDSGEVQVFRVIPGWRIKNALKVMHIVSILKPDVVHIQYPTQGFSGWLPRLLPGLMRLMGLPVVQTWHEHFSECIQICWLNVLACDALIYVRPDLPDKLPVWVTQWLGKTSSEYVPNASTIPNVTLSSENLRTIKLGLSAGKPIVCYFGFAYPNKGVERIFEISDPNHHHLVLICDLSEGHPYQANIQRMAKSEPWAGKVSVTGFLPAPMVGEILAVADAVIFPFPDGAGEWNTSLKAAEAAGAFTIATTKDTSLLGYHEENNIFYASCDDMTVMKEALNNYLGRRVEPKPANEWDRIAAEHERVYRLVHK